MDTKASICIKVINEHSVLARVSGLFSARGYNIETLTVAPIPNTEFSNITILTRGNAEVLEQIIKQLHKLIPVLSVVHSDNLLEKESVLVKLPINEKLADIQALCSAYNGRIANANEKYIILVATDEPSRIENFIKAINTFKPKEIIKSGVIAMERY